MQNILSFQVRAFDYVSGALLLPLLASAQMFQELPFHGAPDGGLPQCRLIQGTDGNFYGTTMQGGVFTGSGADHRGLGTVFKVTPEGVITILGSFNGTNGMYPVGGLVQSADGNFYGATSNGGPGYPNNLQFGTLFRLTPSGAITTVVRFTGDNGQDPVGDLIEGNDGNLYGVTQYGGSDFIDPYYYPGFGTVFKLSTNGDFSKLFSFTSAGSSTNGLNPAGGLVIDRDGNFCGVTSSGGAGADGTVFKVTPAGTLKTIASFQQGAGNAVWPTGRLLVASDGSLYGVAAGGAEGSLFKLTQSGELITMALLAYSDGSSPVGGLVQGWDGNFYGMAYAGGASYGTVFKMTRDAILSPVIQLTGYGGQYPGSSPYGGLLVANDGNLYGTAALDGTSGYGNVFRLLMPGPQLTIMRSAQQCALSWRTNYDGYTLQSSTEVGTSSWCDCTNEAIIAGERFFVTNTISNGTRFFRLKR